MSCHFLWGIWWKEVGGEVDGSRWLAELNFGRLMDSSTTAAAAAGLQGLGACLGRSLVRCRGDFDGAALIFWAFPSFIVTDIQNISTHHDNMKNTLKQNI